MRTFYIFNIKKHFKILTLNNPLLLYKTLEDISKSNKYNIDNNMIIFNQIRKDLNKEFLNNETYNYYKNETNYMLNNNIHSINNYLDKENTRLLINKSYMVIRTNIETPTFINYLKKYDNLFACDFDNKDYFWLSKI